MRAERLSRLLGGWRGAWLLPFIHALAELGEASASALAERLSTRSVVAKSALYALRRAGLVVRTGEGRYRLAEGAAEEYRGMLRLLYSDGRRFLWSTGAHYIYARVSRSRVSAWTLPAYLVERVAEEYRRAPGARPSELGRRLGLHGRTVSRALLAARLAGLLEERVEDDGCLGDGTQSTRDAPRVDRPA